MNSIRGFLLLFLVSAIALRAADAPNADTLWKKVDVAMNALEQPPPTPPKSREESMDYYKKLITTADDVAKEFAEKFPQDPRRWQIRMFDVMTASARPALGLPVHGEMKATLAEVVNATDAEAKVKGDASAALLLIAAEDLEDGKSDSDAWATQVEEHLKKYPDSQLNPQLKEKLDGIKMLADLKTKPLDIKFKAVDGRQVDLAAMRGKVVLVDFWATWCGPCVGEVPNVLKTYEKFHPKGFEIVGISLDKNQRALDVFTKENKMAWPQYFDGKGWGNEFATKFGIRSIPAMWLVDKKGMLVSTNARDALEELVEKQLGE
jgi:thiol-disulfide isomerase/thioredoxin